MRQQSNSSRWWAAGFVLGLLGLLATATPVLAQDATLPQRSTTYSVGPSSNSGLAGMLYIGEFGEDLSVVVFALQGTTAGENHPSHLHTGDCGSGGGVEIPLADVTGESGLGVTVVRLGYDELLSRDFHVNAHRSAREMGTVVACGEVGVGAQADLGGDQAEAGAAQAQAPAESAEASREAQMGLRSESYQLFTILGSGVSGTLNVTEKVGGGTTFVITAVGITPGLVYLPVLFAGDCGPDRERIAELSAVGAIPEDPFASISEVSLSFDQVADGDYFLYLYPEGGEGDPLACGEVGRGANR